MKSTIEDYSFFFKKARGKLIGLMGTYVDDIISAGSDQFRKDTEVTASKFECKEREYDSFRFAGVYIQKLSEGHLIHQKSYIERLEFLDKNSSYANFRSARARLTWIQHTRPEIAAPVNFLSQITEEKYNDKKIKIYNDTISMLKKNPNQGLKMIKLDSDSLHIKVFSDSSFANNIDLSSQLGFIILLCDKYDNCNILYFSSHKSRRIVRSVLGGEVYAFADAFDVSYTIKRDLELMMDKSIRLQIFTDSKSLFGIIK